MRKRQPAEEELMQFLKPVVEKNGISLIDLRRVTEAGRRFLRLYLDKRGGVTIDDCEAISRLVDPILDARGESWHDYLEVQSPGLDRPLETQEELELHLGEDVDVHLYRKLDGRKIISGILKSADESEISLLDGEGHEEKLDFALIAQIRRSIHFS